MTAAAVYARISQLKPGEVRTDSPEDQAELCIAEAVRLGYTVPEDAVFADKGISAYKAKSRPDLDRMLEGVESGKYGAVVFWKIDRVTRNYDRGIELLRRLRDAKGVQIVSLTDGVNLNSGDPMDKAILGFIVAQAEKESLNTGIRNTRKHSTWAAQGVPAVGGNRCFGYQHVPAVEGVSPAGLVPDRIEAEAIRKMVRWILAGKKSLRGCAQWLNENGIRTTAGGAWTGQTVRQMLRNPTLAGIRKLDGVETPGNWKPIIPPDDRERLLVYFASKTPSGSEPVKRLLSGLLRCGQCGSPMYVSVGRYKCFAPVGSDACGNVGAHATKLEAYVTDQVLTFLSAVKLRPVPNVIDPEALREFVEAATKRLRDWDRRHAVLGELSREEWEPIHDELLAVIESSREALSATERKVPTLRPGKRSDLEKWWSAADIDAKRQALAHAVERIEIAKVGAVRNRFDPTRVDIVWNWEAFERTSTLKAHTDFSKLTGVGIDGGPAEPPEIVAGRIRQALAEAPAAAIAAAVEADEKLAPFVATQAARLKSGARGQKARAAKAPRI